jgi:malate dehydrogenase (oxaloacetate-decarboxylating)(NADP+)
MDSGVAKKPIADFEEYKRQLTARLDPTANSLNLLFDKISANPKSIVFSEGEEEKVIRAAAIWRDQRYGTPKLVGREKHIIKKMAEMGVDPEGIEIHNAENSNKIEQYIDFLYKRLQRDGFLPRDCARMVKNDRNVFAACMLQCGDADGMITGLTRNYYDSLDDITKVINIQDDKMMFGMSMMVTKGRTVFISDTTVNDLPTPNELADIAVQTAEQARKMGHTPRVAILSFSNFGSLPRERSLEIRAVVSILDSMEVDFEYDGEMSPDVALNPELMKLYPFCRLSAPANVLIMPALHSASISSKLLQELGGGTLIGPMLIGLEKPVQIVQMGSNVSEILNMAALAAATAIEEDNQTSNVKSLKKSA